MALEIRQQLSLYAAGVNAEKLRLLDQFLVVGKTLDIGCGNGLYGLHVVPRFGSILQIDIADRRDDRATVLPFRVMNAERIDLLDENYDNIIAFDIMEHLDDDAHFLENVRRVCRGRLLLSVPNEEDDQPAKLALTHKHHKDKTHRREYTRDALCAALERANFRVLAIRPQYNRNLIDFSYALARDGFLAKTAARMIAFQCRLFESVKLFENRCIADWFCVAE